MADRKHGFFYRFRLPFKIIGIIFLIGLGLGFAYFLTLLGPQKVSEDDVAQMRLSSEEVSKLVSKSEVLQEKYQSMVRLRKPTDEDYALLEESIEILESAFDGTGRANRTLKEALNSANELYQNAKAEDLNELSRQYEIDQASIEITDPEKRILLFDKAIALQKQINDNFPLSRFRDTSRISRLERQRDAIAAEPLYMETLKAEKEAESAINDGEWEKADAHLLKAIEVQKTINMKYDNLQYADSSRLTRLQRDRVSLKSGRLYERIEAQENEGRAAMEAGKYREAAASFVQAARLQETLNREYDASRFASLGKLEELRGLREMALGTELAEEIKIQLQGIDESLLTRNVWDASEKIQAVRQQIEQFTKTYPRNTLINETLKNKVEFLSYIQNDIVLFQDRIYGQLLPVAVEGSDWHMSRTEVSQALFTSIMLNNPSRNKGELYPVDSITWNEAKQFCQKISWLLARPVRLPTQGEFIQSIGSLRYVNLDDISWNLQNSDGLTHQVGTKEANGAGFYDLLGNVAEWLESENLPGDSEANLAGGSADTSIDILMDKPVEIVSRRTRNRMNGFRIAVELAE